MELRQTSSDQQLRQEPVKKLFWRYALPSITAMLVTGIYAFIDGIFIGQVVGREGLAAIGMVYPLQAILMGISAMIGIGAATLIAIARGRQDHKTSREILGTAFIMLLLLGILAPVIGLITMDPALALMGVDSSLFELARQYQFWIYIGAIFPISSLAMTFLVRNDGRPNLSTALIAVGALSNIVLDYLFIVVLKMELSGAAIATVLAQAIVTIAALIYFYSPQATIKPRWSFSLQRANRIMYAGASSLAMELYIAFFILLHNRVLLHYGSATEVAAFAIIGYIEAILYLVFQGIAFGMQPIISYSIGANLQERLWETTRYGMKVVFTIGLTGLAILQLFPDFITSLFFHNDPELSSVAITAIRLHLATIPFDGYILVGAILLQSMGRVKQSLMATIGKSLLIVPAVLLLPLWLGIDGVWLGVPVTNTLIAGLLTVLLWQQFVSRPNRECYNITKY